MLGEILANDAGHSQNSSKPEKEMLRELIKKFTDGDKSFSDINEDFSSPDDATLDSLMEGVIRAAISKEVKCCLFWNINSIAFR